MDEPWYSEGLRFSCRQCGRCCKGPEPGYVWVSEDEIRRLADHLHLTVEEFGARWLRRVGARYSIVEKPNHDCALWEDGKGCTVYEARPTQCRTFPFWPEFIVSRDKWRTIDWCQGKDSGRLYSRDEIDAASRGDAAASSDGSL